MKKILSALLAAAAVGAMTVAASAETEYFEVAGMKGTMYDVVTADGYDSFVHVWETEDGCSSIATYYFEEGGYYSHYTMELIIPEDCTLEQFNKSLNVFYTEDQITAVDGERYTVNEDSLPDVVGYDELNAEGAREYNREIVIFLKYLEDTQGGEDGTTDDGVAEDGASDDGLTDDGTADDEIVDEGADDVTTDDGAADDENTDASGETDAPADESEKASADTGVHGTVALGVAIAAAGALVLSKKRA
ncbi:MAG: hypothetical protein E7485_08030 [Ruminococcaceae bacterium]|nr:hypothetical protein [Oscillospiraceae bacterium]